MRIIDYNKYPGKEVIKQPDVKKQYEPLISIITPYYNADDNFLFTINSVLSQTFPFFEWIIVNDGSTNEKSNKLFDTLTTYDKRIRTYKKENGGPSVARDYAANRSDKCTKYLFFLDSDDIIESTMLEVLYFALETNKDASFAYSTLVNFQGLEAVSDINLSAKKEKEDNVIFISSLVNKKAFFDVGGFGIKEKNMFEDWGLWLKLMGKGYKPLKVSTPLFWYRKSTTGELSRAKNNMDKAMAYIDSLRDNVSDDLEVYQYPIIGDEMPSLENSFDFPVVEYKRSQKKKNILFLIPWMKTGGADILNLNILKYLDNNKYNKYIITTNVNENELRQEFLEYTPNIYEMPAFIDRKNYANYILYFAKSRNIDVVFISNTAVGYGITPLLKNEMPDIKIFDYVHAIEEDGKGGFGRYSQLFHEYIDYTFTCNNYTKNQLINRFNIDNIDTLYIGTEVDKFDPKLYDSKELKHKYCIPDNKKVISFVGRLSGEKRPFLFVDIAKNILTRRKDIVFLIAGDGLLRKDVLKYIKTNKLNDDIIYIGNIKEVSEVYSISDIIINSSSLEGLSLVCFEAMAMGKPIISGDVGGHKELIDESVGYLIKNSFDFSNDELIKEYTSAVDFVIENYDDLSSNCRKRIIEKFDFKIFMKQLYKYFDKNYKKSNICTNPYELFQFVLLEDYKLHRWLSYIYYKDVQYVDIEQQCIQDSIHSKYEKFKNFSRKKGIYNESLMILNMLRSFKKVLIDFKYFIIAFLRSIKAFLKIVIKLIFKRKRY